MLIDGTVNPKKTLIRIMGKRVLPVMDFNSPGVSFRNPVPNKRPIKPKIAPEAPTDRVAGFTINVTRLAKIPVAI